MLSECRIDRREFLRISTLLGLSAAAAYTVADKALGGSTAGQAMAQSPPKPKGGTVRIGMACQDLTSPHTYSWVESSNSGRAVLDYLTVTGPDNVTRPADAV